MKRYLTAYEMAKIIGAGALFLVAIPVAFVVLSTSHGSPGNSDIFGAFIALSSLVILYTGFQLTRLTLTEKRNLIRIPFYAFCYIWIGVIPLYQFLVGEFPRVEDPSSAPFVRTYILCILGIASFEVGYSIARSRSQVLDSGASPLALSVPLLYALIGFSAAFVLVIGFFLNEPHLLFSTRAEFGAGLSEAGGVMGKQVQNSLLRVPPVILLIVSIWQFRIRDKGGRKQLGVAIALLAILVAISNFPLAISRTWFGTIVISLAVVFYLTGAQKRSLNFAPLLVLGLLLVYPLGTFVRSEQAMTQLPVHEALVSTYTAGSFDVFSQISNTIYTVREDRVSITPGRQLLGPLLFWVPRSVWSEKPVGTGQMVGEQLGLDFLNISAPLWAEGLINFGMPGVFLAFLLYGCACRYLSGPGRISAA